MRPYGETVTTPLPRACFRFLILAWNMPDSVKTVTLRTSSQSGHPFEESLLEQCERIVADSHSQKLTVQLEMRLEGVCPTTHEKTVLRVVDELLTNAMEHGFWARQRGCVFVHVITRPGGGVQVSVSDNGWGFDSGTVVDGNGFHLLRMIGELYLGVSAVAPIVAKTTVTVIIPLHPCRAAASRGA